MELLFLRKDMRFVFIIYKPNEPRNKFVVISANNIC